MVGHQAGRFCSKRRCFQETALTLNVGFFVAFLLHFFSVGFVVVGGGVWVVVGGGFSGRLACRSAFDGRFL